MKIHVTVDLPVSPDEAWDYLRDINSHTEWMVDAESITITSPDTEGVGTTFDCRTVVGFLRTNDQMEITEWEPAQVMGVRHRGLVTGQGRFTLEGREGDHGPETRFSWTEELQLPWFFGAQAGEIVARPILSRIWRRNLRSLRARILERSQPAPELGTLIGTGRMSEVRTHGDEQVIRIGPEGADLEREANAMELVRRAGYPAPAVIERPAPNSIVMQRLHGPTMLDELAAKPWRLVSHARTLARLHRDLASIEAPAEWPQVSPGNSVVHLDLHPDNVKMTPDGPMVFDWQNVGRGDAAFDAALTYVILRTGVPDANPAGTAVINAFRRQFARVFLHTFGAADIRPHLRGAAELRMLDPHLTATEREQAFALARGELD